MILKKVRPGRTRAVPYANLHEQPIPLPLYFDIGDLRSAASAAQISVRTAEGLLLVHQQS